MTTNFPTSINEDSYVTDEDVLTSHLMNNILDAIMALEKEVLKLKETVEFSRQNKPKERMKRMLDK